MQKSWWKTAYENFSHLQLCRGQYFFLKTTTTKKSVLHMRTSYWDCSQLNIKVFGWSIKLNSFFFTFFIYVPKYFVNDIKSMFGIWWYLAIDWKKKSSWLPRLNLIDWQKKCLSVHAIFFGNRYTDRIGSVN